MKISSSTTLAPERYTRDEPNAPIIEIATDGVELDLGGAVFDGENRTSVGILVHDCERVTIRNGVVRGFHWGMLAENVKQLRIERCVVSGNHNPPGLGWLGDDVVPVEEGFGGGIRLVRATDCVLDGNIVHDNLNGIDLVRCQRVTLRGNDASYSGNVGIHLLLSTDNVIEDNRPTTASVSPTGFGMTRRTLPASCWRSTRIATASSETACCTAETASSSAQTTATPPMTT